MIFSGASKGDIAAHVEVLELSGLLDDKVHALAKTIDRVLFAPYLNAYATNSQPSFSIQDDTISVKQRKDKSSLENLLSDFTLVVKYFNSRLPSAITSSLSQLVMPSLLPRLTSGPLAFSVRPDLDGVPFLEKVTSLVESFAQSLEQNAWYGASELRDWISRIPAVWLNRRREHSLYELRRLLMKGLGEPRTVERVETQTVSREDQVFNEAGGQDDWDAKWSDEEENGDKAVPNSSISGAQKITDEEDGSAWGLDDAEPSKPNGTGANEDDEDADAWGWGDDENNPELEPSQSSTAPNPSAQGNRRRASVVPKEREVTLRENYNITAVPEQILEIITQTVLDVESLLQPKYTILNSFLV